MASDISLAFSFVAYNLTACAEGRGVSEDLKEEVAAINNTPMAEEPAEGIHRTTSLVKHHGQASKDPWCLAGLRSAQDFDHIDQFLAEHGERGKTVFNFEWHNFKRLCQWVVRKRYQNVKLNDKAFFRKVYRIDPLQDNDLWHAISSSAPAAKKEIPSLTKLRTEYAQVVLCKGKYYSAKVLKSELQPDGVAAEKEDRFFSGAGCSH